MYHAQNEVLNTHTQKILFIIRITIRNTKERKNERNKESEERERNEGRKLGNKVGSKEARDGGWKEGKDNYESCSKTSIKFPYD